jgi:hypothetical protein
MLNLFGEITEIGILEGENGALGIVIKRLDGSFITIKGLTEDETRACCHLFCKVELKIEGVK